MFFFTVPQDVIIKDRNGHSQTFKASIMQGKLYPACIYCSTLSDFDTFKKICPSSIIPLNEVAIRRSTGFPIELGISNTGEFEDAIKAGMEMSRLDTGLDLATKLNAFKAIRNKLYNNAPVSLIRQLKPLFKKNSVRIALINLATGLGDSVAAITALKLLYQFLMQHFSKVEIDIYLLKFNNNNIINVVSLLKDCASIKHILYLPAPLDKLLEYDAFIDNSGLANREFFFKLPIIDAFLFKFGLDINQYNKTEKRNELTIHGHNAAIKSFFETLKKQTENKIILLHFRSSSDLRNVPEQQINEALNILTKHQQYTFISALKLASRASNFIDISFLSRSLDDYIQIIASVDGIITVDTSTYHIADAFSIPTIILATTFASELYSRYYPFAEPYIVPGAKNSVFYYEHNLKDARKVIRITDLKPAIDDLWMHLDIDAALKQLTQIMNHRATSTNGY